MNRILIFGNSGSGKSTLAKHLSDSLNLAHLDLDTVAWKPVVPPERHSLENSWREIDRFVKANENWVLEGCYTDLLELIQDISTEIIFMNLPVELCVSNARNRPWEPHKYDSKKEQDNNLDMLIDWISQYTERQDTFSYSSHQQFYDNYVGNKKTITCNQSYV